MEALTPASPESLPPLGALIADEPFWQYPLSAAGREGVAHLRVWLTAGPEPGHLAVVTETGSAASVTRSAGRIWAELARRYGPSPVLLEHHLAPVLSEGMETLDLARHRRRRQPALAASVAGAGGEPRRSACVCTTRLAMVIVYTAELEAPSLRETAGVDPLGEDSPLMVLAPAGALALVSRVEAAGSAVQL